MDFTLHNTDQKKKEIHGCAKQGALTLKGLSGQKNKQTNKNIKEISQVRPGDAKLKD